MPTRYFTVRKGRDADDDKGIAAVPPQYLVLDDADDKQQADYQRARASAFAGNKGLKLDRERAEKVAALIWKFTTERVSGAVGFKMSSKAGEPVVATLDLVWPADKDAIIELIPIGLKNLLRTTVFAINFPDTFQEYEQAAQIASEDIPN